MINNFQRYEISRSRHFRSWLCTLPAFKDCLPDDLLPVLVDQWLADQEGMAPEKLPPYLVRALERATGCTMQQLRKNFLQPPVSLKPLPPPPEIIAARS